MATKAKRHTHKYHRVNAGYQMLWACALPDCNHHMPLHLTALVEGKASICWKCGEQMILDSDAMKLDKPICIDCRGINELNEFLNKTA
jgi:hypothetical protein